VSRFTIACLVVVGAGTVACGGGSTAPTCSAPVAASAVQLVDFSFDPGCVGADAGETLTLTNTGGAPHSYTVKGTSVNVQVDPGQSQTATLADIAPGVYAVICTYHPQMVGALKVG
jgi:plastocyanin